MKRALVSVSDKNNLVPFVKKLVEHDFEIVSTGGTKKYLDEAGIKTISVEEVTHFPEILDGRVKTLNPYIHGGLLARRELPEHMETLKEQNITPIDLVCVNLYPFKQTIENPEVTLENAIENIDIGGPSMLRSAAKNYRDVVVVVDANDYEGLEKELDENGEILENLDGGEIFDVLEAGTDWLKIQTAKGTTGYVSTEYVSLRKGEKPASNRIAPAPSGEGLQVIEYAQRFLGTPYVWAGTDLENGVDCSGYVYAVMQHFGVSLNRSSAAMTAHGVDIDK